MTKEELKELVATKIAGQGNQVDTGSTLPAILNGIIDKLFEGVDLSAYAKKVEIDDIEDFDESTAYQTGDIVRYDGKLYKFTANKDAGEWDATKVEQTNVFTILYEMIDELREVTPTVTISALQSADLTAEQAAAAGFTPAVIAMLQQAHKPTIEFSDMCVSFNAVEVISDDLVNQSTIIVHTAVGGGTLYKAILSLYTDGRVVYTVTEIQ